MVPAGKPFDWDDAQSLDDIPHYDRSQRGEKPLISKEMILVPNMLNQKQTEAGKRAGSRQSASLSQDRSRRMSQATLHSKQI